MKASEKVCGKPLTEAECLRAALAGILQELRAARVVSSSDNEECAVIEYKINISVAMMSYLESLAKGER